MQNINSPHIIDSVQLNNYNIIFFCPILQVAPTTTTGGVKGIDRINLCLQKAEGRKLHHGMWKHQFSPKTPKIVVRMNYF